MRNILLILLTTILLVGCAPQLYKVEDTQNKLSTVVTITVYDSDKTLADNAVKAGFSEIDRLNDIFNAFDPKYELGKLNNESILYNPSSELLFVLNKSRYYHDISNGSFDVTVQPILDYYKQVFSSNKTPKDEEIAKVLELVDYDGLFFNDTVVRLDKPGMEVTLGGIAKGYIADKVVEKLQSMGIKHALVSIAGDIRAIGNKGTEDWSIALQNPRNKDEYITLITLNNRSVSTSGDYERFFVPDKSIHHIINPRTGKSATDLISVTIVTDKAIDADALATSVFVLGPVEGLKLAEDLDNVEALLITKDKKILKTTGFVW